LKFDEYARQDAVGLAELVRRKEVTPRELVEVALARLEQVNPRLNAVVHRLDERALSAASGPLPEGPFRGVPFLVKDLDGTLAGAPYTASSRALRGYVAPHDSELFARYKRAGLVILGKTNTPEFGLFAYTEPELHGPCRNPWNLGHSPGGSSGGSAAAVAAGVVPVAHGGDGGGSIRIPASACGLFGLKPTRARTPLGPDEGESWHGMVVRHVLTRTVRDSAALLDATHGPDVGAPYHAPPPERPFLEEVGREPGRLRIAFTSRSLFGEGTHPDCKRALEEAMRLCESLGHQVFEVDLPLEREALRLTYLVLVCSETAHAVEATQRRTGRPPTPDKFEPSTWFLAQVGRSLPALAVERAREHMFRSGRQIATLFAERFDVLATPTLAYPPMRVGELAPTPAQRALLAAMRRFAPRAVLERALNELAGQSFEKTPNTMLFNMTGQPAMSVPLSWNEAQLPIGVQFAGRFGDEATLLRLASQLEAARPWAQRRPPL
jgi:amidase